MKRRITAALTAMAIALTTVALVSAPPASAAIGSWHWARATIYVQNDSPTNSWNDEMMDRVNYYRTISGDEYYLIDGPCRLYYPCIVVKEADYGSTSWYGLTTFALGNTPAGAPDGCGTAADPYVWCNYTGASGTWTTVRLNTHLEPGEVIYRSEIYAGACHEFGHGLAGLQHATGTTCMNATISPSTATVLSSAEGGQIRTRFSTIPY